MALSRSIRPGRKREKRGANRQIVYRSRQAGAPIEDYRANSDERQYVDLEMNQDGSLVTDPDTVPRNP